MRISSIILFLSFLLFASSLHANQSESQLSNLILGSWDIENYSNEGFGEKGQITFHQDQSVETTGWFAAAYVGKASDVIGGRAQSYGIASNKVLIFNTLYKGNANFKRVTLVSIDHHNQLTLVSGERVSILKRQLGVAKKVIQNNPIKKVITKKEPTPVVKVEKKVESVKTIDPKSILPVQAEFKFFRANAKKKNVNLYWQADFKDKATSFQIHRSKIPSDYVEVAKLDTSKTKHTDYPRKHGVYNYKILALNGDKVIAEDIVRIIVR